MVDDSRHFRHNLAISDLLIRLARSWRAATWLAFIFDAQRNTPALRGSGGWRSGRWNHSRARNRDCTKSGHQPGPHRIKSSRSGRWSALSSASMSI